MPAFCLALTLCACLRAASCFGAFALPLECCRHLLPGAPMALGCFAVVMQSGRLLVLKPLAVVSHL